MQRITPALGGDAEVLRLDVAVGDPLVLQVADRFEQVLPEAFGELGVDL